MILHKLREAPGSLAKEHILRFDADTYDKAMFQYAYDPDQMYYLKFNNIRWETVKPFADVDRILLDHLLAKTLTGSAARGTVEHHCKQYGDLVKLICNKDLDCGVSTTTLNKIFGKGFIPKFAVQLATEIPIANIPVPIVGQLKYNGVRVVALITNTSVTLKTRNGKTFRYPLLEEYLNCITVPVMLDGELTDCDNKSHTSVSGLVNSAIKGTPIPDYQGLVFNVFDCMPLDEFNSQSCMMDYEDRFHLVKSYVAYLHEYCEGMVQNIIKVAQTWEFHTTDQIQEKFDRVLAAGYEGLILKSWQHLYTFKRSKDWIKLKAVETADLMCVDWQEGEGKYEGMIGALICQGQINDKQIWVKVGSGLSDADRIQSTEEYIGKMIEVKYNTLIQDSTDGSWSLFLPRFVTVRGDL